MATAVVDGLREGFEGTVLGPGDSGYDEARTVFNAMIDRRPAVIAQPETTEAVARAIAFGRTRGLEIAVRGGGHSVAGMALNDGGLVIDLRRIRHVTVDPEARTVRVGGGATMSDLDRGTEPYGLATTGGRVSTTGVGGLLLGGGGGWMDRLMGLAVDNLVEVELVTAAGEPVTANERTRPELFWALHGGGGNFGVATAFTLRLHELSTVTPVLLLWPGAEGPRVMRRYRDLVADAPDEVGGAAIFLTGPPEEFVPEELVDRLCFGTLVVVPGDEAGARRAAAPLLELRPAAEMTATMPYADFQCLLDDPPGFRNYWSAEYLDSFPDAAVDAFCAQGAAMPVPTPSQLALAPQGGAVTRGPAEYPVPWRAARWIVHPFGMWENPDDDQRGRDWTHAVRDAVRPWSGGSVYLNFIGEEGHGRVVAGFGEENYRRLARVKAEYDPGNVFHLNHNIKPV